MAPTLLAKTRQRFSNFATETKEHYIHNLGFFFNCFKTYLLKCIKFFYILHLSIFMFCTWYWLQRYWYFIIEGACLLSIAEHRQQFRPNFLRKVLKITKYKFCTAIKLEFKWINCIIFPSSANKSQSAHWKSKYVTRNIRSLSFIAQKWVYKIVFVATL